MVLIYSAVVASALALSGWAGTAYAQSDSFTFTKTVGTDPSQCASAQQITVKQGDTVVYCYKITNTGSISLTTHTLIDDVLGPISIQNPITVPPGGMFFITKVVQVSGSITNVATWTSTDINGDPPISSEAFDPGSTAFARVIPNASAPTLSDVGIGLAALALLLVGASRLTLQRNSSL